MSESDSIEEVVWTPQMPDRRKGSRRDNARNVQPNGKQLKVALPSSERRRGKDRRKTVTVTITGRAIDVVHDNRQ
ncbi:MAG: hypothetical protein ACI9N9_000637 [Enterobacterales bacterium]|jgi:hypothetical protein